VLDQQHAAAALTRLRGAHHAGGACAEDDDVPPAIDSGRRRRLDANGHSVMRVWPLRPYSTGWMRSSTSGRGAERA